MSETAEPTHFSALRRMMVEEIAQYADMAGDAIGKHELDPRVMAAMGKVPRHEFVPVELRGVAYADSPLPIGHGKTVSQPFMVAVMTDLLALEPDDSVLEIGTGLGYQAAVLAELAGKVYSVEILSELAEDAKRRLRSLGYEGIELRVSDGAYGWPEHAPFDKVMVTAAPELMPPHLLGQLKPGGTMVIPAGIESAQQLLLVTKNAEGRIKTREMMAVRFSQLVTSH